MATTGYAASDVDVRRRIVDVTETTPPPVDRIQTEEDTKKLVATNVKQSKVATIFVKQNL